MFGTHKEVFTVFSVYVRAYTIVLKLFCLLRVYIVFFKAVYFPFIIFACQSQIQM